MNNTAAPEVIMVRGYHTIACDGEAHGNAHIDSCMRCAPLWGRVVVKTKTGEKASARIASRWSRLAAAASDSVDDLRRNANAYHCHRVTHEVFSAENGEIWRRIEAQPPSVMAAVMAALRAPGFPQPAANPLDDSKTCPHGSGSRCWRCSK